MGQFYYPFTSTEIEIAGGLVSASIWATDNAIIRTDGTGGRDSQESGVTIGDVSGNNVTVTAITNTALTLATLDNNRDITFTPHGTGLVRFSKSAVPNASDGAALGSAALPWSDAFFASGGVIDFAGDVTLTHGTDILTMAGGRFVNSFNAAASSPPVSVTGSWFSGGSATTTKPQLLIEASGATSTGWSTSGTGVGVNAASGFAGRLFDLQVNGVTQANFSAAGDFAGNGAMSAAGGVMARNATATPAGGSSQCFSMGSVGIGISFGSGAPSTSRPKGSWYMRTDGSGVNDRAYVATDAVGGWTAFVTVA